MDTAHASKAPGSALSAIDHPTPPGPAATTCYAFPILGGLGGGSSPVTLATGFGSAAVGDG